MRDQCAMGKGHALSSTPCLIVISCDFHHYKQYCKETARRDGTVWLFPLKPEVSYQAYCSLAAATGANAVRTSRHREI